uniref:isocitrate lyase/PEP mutase family protein n=1 Tax=Altererythrobacter segetis TaxID=1104773 RepID=UPI0014085543|nr:isocitrate lyase/phosphoenolpyruvate mutase family protein [Altererythrobacter segetis]
MNSQLRKRFAELHVPGHPVLLYNIWDVGSAKAVAKGGALALAAGSHSLAEANGFPDGERIPFNLFLDCIRRIVQGVDLPVSADFEGGFAADAARVADHARYLAETGAVGCNFEDQEVGGPGLHPIEHQAQRVAAVVESGLWVNARTDLFLRKLIAGENPNDRSLFDEALERAKAYAEAGAHSFFVPGVSDLSLIADICAASPLPVNVIKPADHDIAALARAGVARISWGPRPWIWAMDRLTEEAAALYR